MLYKNVTRTTLHVDGYRMLAPNHTISLDKEDLKKPNIEDMVKVRKWLVACNDKPEVVETEEEKPEINWESNPVMTSQPHTPKPKEENTETEENEEVMSELTEYQEAEKRNNKPIVHDGNKGFKIADRLPMTVHDANEMLEENKVAAEKLTEEEKKNQLSKKKNKDV